VFSLAVSAADGAVYGGTDRAGCSAAAAAATAGRSWWRFGRSRRRRAGASAAALDLARALDRAEPARSRGGAGGQVIAGLGDGTLLQSDGGGESWSELGERFGATTALAVK
jgi:hypothetical protein